MEKGLGHLFITSSSSDFFDKTDIRKTNCLMLILHCVFAIFRPYGIETCIGQAFVYFTCGYTSVVFLVAITLNRLIGIIYPTR